jgi:hypothetical protein
MELEILVLDRHRIISSIMTNLTRAPTVFAQTVIKYLTAYNHASGGTLNRSSLSLSFFTERISVMMIGSITPELYSQVEQRIQFELKRQVFDSTE